MYLEKNFFEKKERKKRKKACFFIIKKSYFMKNFCFFLFTPLLMNHNYLQKESDCVMKI